MAYQYAFVMKGLSKTYPGANKPCFKDITLSFLPGAKIAIIGPNGAGKSTLMKVIAGIDTEYVGEAWAAEGVRVAMPCPVQNGEPDLCSIRSWGP